MHVKYGRINNILDSFQNMHEANIISYITIIK